MGNIGLLEQRLSAALYKPEDWSQHLGFSRTWNRQTIEALLDGSASNQTLLMEDRLELATLFERLWIPLIRHLRRNQVAGRALDAETTAGMGSHTRVEAASDLAVREFDEAFNRVPVKLDFFIINSPTQSAHDSGLLLVFRQ